MEYEMDSSKTIIRFYVMGTQVKAKVLGLITGKYDVHYRVKVISKAYKDFEYTIPLKEVI